MALGYNARVNASTKVVIGNTAVTSIGGYADWTNFSDQRFKTAVQENVKGLEFILKLRPVTYQLDINKLAAVLKEDQRIDDDGKIIMDSTSSMDLVSREEKSGIVYTGFLPRKWNRLLKVSALISAGWMLLRTKMICMACAMPSL